MAMSLPGDARIDMQREETSSLRTLEDCQSRLDRIAKIFNDPNTDTQDTVQLKVTMSKVENLLVKETKTWWDLSTLQQYLDKDMVPRGLRIKKHPTTLYGDEFVEKWNSILTSCSKKLMELIISFENTALSEIRNEIKTLQGEIVPLAECVTFKEMDTKIKNNIAKLETTIAEIKKSKYMRDLQDYKSDTVYTWFKRDRINTPRSILKRSDRQRGAAAGRVNFDSTEPETSDTASDWSDHNGQNNTRPNLGKTNQMKQKNKKKNPKNGEQAENTGAAVRTSLRNLRSAKTKS